MGLCESADELRLPNSQTPDGQPQPSLFGKKTKEKSDLSSLSPGCRGLFSSATVEPMPQIYRKSVATPVVRADPVPGIHLELTDEQAQAVARFWRETITVNERDIFHRTMLFCIEASPKLNEIIACGRYCFRDLTKWPKLNKLCQAQFAFFERIIIDWKCDEEHVRNASLRLGVQHAQYATYGMKPHFFDIYQQQFLGLIQKCSRDMPPTDRELIFDGFTALTGFVIDLMNVGQTLRPHR